MARVSDYRVREFVEGLNLTSAELVDLLEIETRDIISKFPNKLRKNLDKLGFYDMEECDGEDTYTDVSSICEE